MPEIFKNRKFYLIISAILLLLGGVYFFLCSLASEHAEDIFRQEMSKQRVLRGSVTADSIKADLFGNVSFTNLVWLDPKGEPVLQVPQGKFSVSVWDIITHSADLDTLQRVELDDAVLSLQFDEKMRLDVLPDKKMLSEPTPQKKKKHLDLRGKVPETELVLKNCTLNVMYKKRYFVLNQVQANIQSRTDDFIKIDFASGLFGGTIAGDSLKLYGKVDVSKDEPELALNLTMYNIIPSSMGLGKIENPADIFLEVKGPLQQPKADGALNFDELNIPALHFSKVSGNIHYEDGRVDFTDVTGSVYGGTVDASGNYHIDNRHYSIDVLGHDLMASVAAKSTKINCRVELDLKMRSEGRADTVHTYGSFTSGPGNYMLIPFESISGKFDNKSKVLKFKDVVIKTNLGNVVTDGFKLVDGRVYLEDIYLEAPDGSEKIKVR